MSNKKPRGQIQAPCTKEGAVTPLFLLFVARIKMEMEISQNTPEKYIQPTKSSLISHHLRLIIGSICKISWNLKNLILIKQHLSSICSKMVLPIIEIIELIIT